MTTPDPRLAHLAALFLGRAEELSGKLESAASRYRRAAELCASAQSPWFALSRLGRRFGNLGVGRDSLRNALSRHDDDLWTNPWWQYHRWQVEDPGRLMDSVRALARLEPRS